MMAYMAETNGAKRSKLDEDTPGNRVRDKLYVPI